jgi:hypothetical protein
VNDLVLRLCLHAYPLEVREPDGRVILDLARDLSSKGGISMTREAVGMLLGAISALVALPAVFWPLFYLVDAVLVCLVIWMLLRHRRLRATRTVSA